MSTIPSSAASSVSRRLMLGMILAVTTLAFLHSPGTSDVAGGWLPLMNSLEKHGLVRGYLTHDGENYPPLTTVFLFAASEIGQVLAEGDFVGLKILLSLFLLLTTAVFWLWTRDLLLTVGLHLTLLLSSVALGYLDILWAPPFLISFWALTRKRYALFAVSFSVAALTKWQPLIIAPFLLVYLFKAAGLRRTVLHAALPVLLILGGVYAVYGNSILVSLIRGVSDGTLSAQALNYGWVITHALHIADPADYGPLSDGECQFVKIPVDRPLLSGLKLLFWVLYAAVLVMFLFRAKTFEDLVSWTLL